MSHVARTLYTEPEKWKGACHVKKGTGSESISKEMEMGSLAAAV